MSSQPASRGSSRGRGRIQGRRGRRGQGNQGESSVLDGIVRGVRRRGGGSRNRGRGRWGKNSDARGGRGSWRGGASRVPGKWWEEAPRKAVVSDSSVDSDCARDYVRNLLNGDKESGSDSSSGGEYNDADEGRNGVSSIREDTFQPIVEPEVLRWAVRWGAMGEFIRECQSLLRFLVTNKAGSNIGNVFDFSPRQNRFRLVVHKVCDMVGAKTISIGKGRERFVCVSPAEELVVPGHFEDALVVVLQDIFPLSGRDNSRRRLHQQRWKCAGSSLLDVEFLRASDSDRSDSEAESIAERFADEAGDGSTDIAGLVAYSMTQKKIDEIWGDDCDDVDPEELFGGLDRKPNSSGVKRRGREEGEKLPKVGHSLYGNPIDESNRGFGLLQKMGWSEGQGLGVDGEGRTEPVGVDVRHTRKGLG